MTGPVPVDLFVVRHAHAGDRGAWNGHDDGRPLSTKGRRQAAGLADLLAGAGIERVLSSPATRCVQTLEPLAERLGVPVGCDRRLQEGASPRESLALVEGLRDAGGRIAVCSHGDVIPDVLRSVRDLGARIDDELRWPKASTWVICAREGRWSTGHYLPPP